MEKLDGMVVYCAMLPVSSLAPPSLSTPPKCAILLGSLTATFLVPESDTSKTSNVQLQYKDKATHSCQTCILRT